MANDKITNPDGYFDPQFKKYLNEYQKSHSYAYHKTYIPGKEWQIDFAGDPLPYRSIKRMSHQSCASLLYHNLQRLFLLPSAARC